MAKASDKVSSPESYLSRARVEQSSRVPCSSATGRGWSGLDPRGSDTPPSCLPWRILLSDLSLPLAAASTVVGGSGAVNKGKRSSEQPECARGLEGAGLLGQGQG